MISIIIIVKNDRGIENTLNSLKKVKKLEKTEIIVVDASKKETLLDIKKKFSSVRWIYFHNKTNKKITIPEQRNLGIKKAKGDIIVFIDANCMPERDWLTNLTFLLTKNRESLTAGNTLSENDKDIHDLKIKEDYLEESPTINLALKKEIISKVGYFDEMFNYGSDMDFTWRARDLGYKIKNVRNAKITHNWGNLKTEIKRAERYGEARFNLHLKHKDRRWKFKNSGIDLFTLYSILFFFYLLSVIPISIFYPAYLLLILIPFFKNIKESPFRKMIFDFFWGYGFIKKLLKHYLFDNDPKK